MNKLPNSLQNKANNYNSLNKEEKRNFIDELYNKKKWSYPQIAELVGTYANKIRRDAKGLGLQARTTAEAQSIAIETGRHDHPTKGKNHTQAAKLKISEKMANTWENLTEEEKAYRSQIGKDHWDSLSFAEKAQLGQKAGEAIRLAAKEGSKLEKYLLDVLTHAGYVVEFHREQIITNQRLQVDLFLPKLRTAIEVDGPSHFRPIWGQEVLDRNIRADNQKSGLVLAQGWCLIRIRQTQSLSQIYKRSVAGKLLKELSNIKSKFPERKNRLIIIGEENGN